MPKKYEDFTPEADIKDYVKDILEKRGKEFHNLVEDIEKTIRQTPEYKLWSIKHRKSVDKCQVCGIEFNKKIKAEVHHTPLTLYEIVVNALDELINSGKELTTTEVIDKVIDWHVNEKIGSLTICTCCHKQAHYEREEFGEEITINSVLRKRDEQGQ